MNRKGFKKGDVIRFTKEYFEAEDFGASGIVLTHDPYIYRDELYTFIGYIEGDTAARGVAINKRNRVFITIDGFIEKAIQ